MRASRSHAAQHITLENVCTRARPAQLPEPGVGLVVHRDARAAQRLEALEQRDVAAVRQALVEEHVRRREDRRAVDVVLDLPPRVVADAHRTHAAVAGQRCPRSVRPASALPLMR